jgi:hypothetical protein
MPFVFGFAERAFYLYTEHFILYQMKYPALLGIQDEVK